MYNFNEIIGNKNIIKSMQAAAEHNRINHAYILCGSHGCGKKLMALSFVKAILCSNVCNECVSCKALDAGSHADIIFVQATKKSLGIDDIREQIVDVAAIKPYSGERRIFIIDNAETMTIPAQNALLKTLEDGPKHAVFFLLSKNSDIFLPTVLSRCVMYKIPPLSPNVVEGYLTKLGFSSDVAHVGANHCGGAIGRAIEIAGDDSFLRMQENIMKIVRDVDSKGIADIFAAAKALEEFKEHFDDVVDILLLFFREELTENPVQAAKKIRIVQDIRQKLKQNCNFLLAIEVMMLKLAAISNTNLQSKSH